MKPNKFVVITISDKGAAGLREDTSGPAVGKMLAGIGLTDSGYEVIEDDYEKIRSRLIHYADEAGIALVVTTGGTGFAPRDVTPEATRAVIEKEAPGLAEAMRAGSLELTPHGMLSRSVAGIRKSTLIVNLPGSKKASTECLEVILPALPHGLELIAGCDGDCSH
jgi:molybdenum cofactor synthesis domain-containing protein